MIKTHRTITYLLISLLTLCSCREEPLNELEPSEIQNPDYSISKISLVDFSDELQRDSHHAEILSLFNPREENELNKNVSKTFYLNKNNIVKITKKQGTSYTI